MSLDSNSPNQIRLASPTVEQHPTGFGIGVSSPRLSWRFITDSQPPPGWEQTAYEIELSRPEPKVYRVSSSDSVLVPWPAAPLTSREKACVRVRAFGVLRGQPQEHAERVQEMPTTWSPWTAIECGLLNRHDWTADFIGAAESALMPTEGPMRPLRFRRVFCLPAGTVCQARLYITCLGGYRAFINGRRVGNDALAPGWTSYNHRLHYQTFDVTDLVNSGENVLAVEVSECWYAGRLGFNGGHRRIYGDQLGILAQLEAQDSSSNRVSTIASDPSWRCAPSAIVRSELYDGEVYDDREEQPGWDGTPLNDGISFNSRDWSATKTLSFPDATLVSSDKPPVRVIEERDFVHCFRTASGKTILDFGQNLVGRLCVPYLRGTAGSQIIFRHAEVLENGELGTRPLRQAKCADEVILSGNALRDWSPQFTYHGFRYVQVEGWPDDTNATVTGIKAQIMHTDLTRTGWFTCSNPMVNKLHENVLWSMRGNFVSIPTDCPQRDERLGWTGDIQIFCPSASFLYNTAGMLSDWLADLAAEQLEPGRGGVPPVVVPDVLQSLWPATPQAIWDDVTVLNPWSLYQAYGDKDILSAQYESMLAWLDYGIRRGSDGLWDPDVWQLGDWLDPIAPPEEPGDARTDPVFVADAYLVHVTSIMAQVCQSLNKTSDTARFGKQAESAKASFQRKYITPSGLIVGDSQTALSLAIVFDLHVTAEQKAEAGHRLAYLVRRAKFKVATGFAGTPIITHALSSTGHSQHAYRMLLENRSPSWMYPVTQGATTTWERWDSMLPDGRINPGEMTSFNHYALGSIVNWMHASVAGISPLRPGWKEVLVRPVPGGGIDSAEAVHETPYGRLECRWRMHEGSVFLLEVVIPPNTTACVVLPESENTVDSVDDGLWAGSGRHSFSCKFDARLGWPPKPITSPVREQEDDVLNIE